MSSPDPIPVTDITCPICGGEVGYQCGVEPTDLNDIQNVDIAKSVAWSRVPSAVKTKHLMSGNYAYTEQRPPAFYYPAKAPWPPDPTPAMGGWAQCRKGVDPNRGRWSPKHSCLWRGTPVYRGQDGVVYLAGSLQPYEYRKGEVADFLFPSDIQKLGAVLEDMGDDLEKLAQADGGGSEE